jgi:TIR domain
MVADDIRHLGHEIWLDQELTGGHAWWSDILASVRRCDVFVFLLSRQSLNSVACSRECNYATAVHRVILPILVCDEVSTNVLPQPLAELQYVDYRQRADRGAVFRLAKAFSQLPPGRALPNPLPPEPAVPVSYLGGIGELIHGAESISYEKQCQLLMDLKGGLRDPQTSRDAQELLGRLRQRRDLFAAIATEIDSSLASAKPASPAPLEARAVASLASETPAPRAATADPIPTTQSRTASAVAVRPTVGDRIVAAFCAAMLAALLGAIALSGDSSAPSGVIGVTVVGGAIAGALSAKRRGRMRAAALGAFVGWIILAALSPSPNSIAVGGILGSPIGAILGPLIVKLVNRMKNAPASV